MLNYQRQDGFVRRVVRFYFASCLLQIGSDAARLQRRRASQAAGRGVLAFRLTEGVLFPLKVVEILFYDKNRVKLVVEMADPNRYSTEHAPHIPRLLFKLFPHLARHRCDNDNGLTFRKESRSTEIPHLFEHLIIELQGQVQKTRVLKGETQWNWRIDPRGRFHVYVDYENEILVLGAIRLAERIISALDNRQIEQIDIEREVEKLRALTQLGLQLYDDSPAASEAEAASPSAVKSVPPR